MPDSSDADGAFLLSRRFDTTAERLWRAFTDIDELKQWWGPAGFELAVAAFDLRPGGKFVYSMSAAGQTLWGRFVYREIEAPRRIVFVNSFSDAAGGLGRAPFNPAWPLEVLNTWTFQDQDGQALLSMRGTPVDTGDAERAIFMASFDSMRMGFGGTLDQLRDHLGRSA